MGGTGRGVEAGPGEGGGLAPSLGVLPCPTLPSPHSPAQVSVRTSAPGSSRRRVLGPMTRISGVWGEASPAGG